MAKYTITLACGHEQRVILFGRHEDRERRMEWMGANMKCAECQKVDFAAKNEQAAQLNQDEGFPPLEGSEKQIAWAETLRRQVYDAYATDNAVQEVISTLRGHFQDVCTIEQLKASPYTTPDANNALIVDLIDTMFGEQTKASWWIDHRQEYIPGCTRPNPKSISDYERINEYLLKAWGKAIKNGKPAHPDIPAPIQEEPKDALQEATVYPGKTIMETVVTITGLESKVLASCEKNDEFRKIVKGLGYEWNQDKKVWQRSIPETAGTIQDRAAELGNKLLNSGFPVRIQDADIRQKAIDGTYEPEHTRWIYVRTKGGYVGRIALSWERGDDLYATAKKLPGAKWDSGYMVVKPEHFEVIEEFAQLYDFRCTQTAQKAIDDAKAARAAAQIVTPAKVEDPEKPDGLKDILQSSSAVLSDLQD